MYKRYFIFLMLCIVIIVSCGRYDRQYKPIVTPERVTRVQVTCLSLLNIPVMCAVIDQTTRTVRIENVIKRIVDRIVKKEVIREVPIERIVKRIEYQYIETGTEIDIEEIVNVVIERVREYVKPSDIIEVPTDVIVDETVDYISNPPPTEDKDSTTIGDIRQDTPTITPENDNEGKDMPNTDGENSDDNSKDGGSNGSPDPDDDEQGRDIEQDDEEDPDDMDGPPDDDEQDRDTEQDDEEDPDDMDGSPDPDDDEQDRDTEQDDEEDPDDMLIDDDDPPVPSPIDESTIRLRVQIGPKKMNNPLSLEFPGVNTWLTCEIDGNTLYPPKESLGVFTGDRRNLRGIQYWCDVPESLDDSDITVHVSVRDLNRWCGLTASDIKVSKFIRGIGGTLTGGATINANVVLDPEVVPACNNPPVFSDGGSTTRYVLEGTPPGVAIGLPVEAIDLDDDDLEYTLSGTDASSFSLDSDSGQLRTSDPLDYEVRDSYSVIVTVSDTKEGKDRITVAIIVTDDNEAPTFTDESPTMRSVPENTPSNEAIGEPVEATDENDDPLEYALSGTDANSFSIESGSGQILTSDPLNYEVRDSYSVVVIVTDNKGGTDEIMVTINVSDENDAPVFTERPATNRSVDENTASNVAIGSPVSAEDEDDDTLIYSLAGTDASSFSIEMGSGQLKTLVPLDHEMEDTYSVLVSVSDNNGGTDEIAVTIIVNDINDAPIFTEDSPTSRSVAENLSSGVAFGEPVLARDQDINDILEYSLAGTDASSFSIEMGSGQLKTNASFNYEEKDAYTVLVTVDDKNGGTDEITVSINITDENDRPEFEGFFTSRSVAENLAPGAAIGDPVEAMDEDEDTLVYSIVSANTDIFSVDDSDGQLRTKVTFNYEEVSVYQVSLSVSDMNGGTSGIFVTVNVTDENDAPMFDEGDSTARAVLESVASGGNINGKISATDEDGDSLTYSLSGTDATSFGINMNNGQLSTNITLDYDMKDTYTVTVSVTDNRGGSDEITVTIEVIEFYISKEEFYEVYYAIKLADAHLEVQVYTIRGYGFDGDTPVYVDNYYKFADGSPSQVATGWGSATEEGTISNHLEDHWRMSHPEENDYDHANMRISLKDTTADAVKKTIYQAICTAAHNKGTWSENTRGITFPGIDNNTSDDILDIHVILLSYLEDDDCDPDN